MIKEAIEKRASYFKANSQTITSLGARRLLEEDLKLDKNSLDEYKSFINKKLEEVLLSPEVVEPVKWLRKDHRRNLLLRRRLSKTIVMMKMRVLLNLRRVQVKMRRRMKAHKIKEKTFSTKENKGQCGVEKAEKICR
ncbi:hypothetical protein QJS10_CPB19g01798 [Acorus calamus]|uniref:Uncharacterized protein n=1 Tax=Acorus calamus TaxID=4465 RepID=A0AAV9CH02_ACOCL|nr:hypothetical protein QJS10_CPB19g01798 [Acorus calamus]